MKKFKQSILALLLFAAMLLTTVPALAADMRFTDVPETAWYYNDVRLAVESGLVNGKSDTLYAPDDNVTYAETVKLAAAMWMLANTGSTEFEKSSPWYQTYVDYAKTNKIITKDYEWNDAATRANFMDIFSRALPDKPVLTGAAGLEAINEIADGSIPDVPMTHPQAASIYKMYRAGIVTGSDEAHSCKPNTSIKRSEVAAILTRMMYADKRQSFTLGEVKSEERTEPLKFTQQPQSVSAPKDGSASFAVAVTGGTAPYTYQWQSRSSKHDWTDLTKDPNKTAAGFHTPTLTIFKKLDVAASLDYQFRCVVTDANGNQIISNAADIRLTPDIVITKQPESYPYAFLGDWVEFTVTVTGGAGSCSYEWQVLREENPTWTRLSDAYHSSFYRDADEPTLRIWVSSADQYEEAQYRCVVTDEDGNSVVSGAAAVTHVLEPLTIITHPDSCRAFLDTWVKFTVEAAGGDGNYTYEWQVQTDNDSSWRSLTSAYASSYFSGADQPELSILVSSSDKDYHAKYRCVITDGTGKTIPSDYASVIVTPKYDRPSVTRP